MTRIGVRVEDVDAEYEKKLKGIKEEDDAGLIAQAAQQA